MNKNIGKILGEFCATAEIRLPQHSLANNHSRVDPKQTSLALSYTCARSRVGENDAKGLNRPQLIQTVAAVYRVTP